MNPPNQPNPQIVDAMSDDHYSEPCFTVKTIELLGRKHYVAERQTVSIATPLRPMNTPEPMNTSELPQAEAAMTEEVKAEFEKVYKKLREQSQYLYISHLINSITIILLLLFPLPQ